MNEASVCGAITQLHHAVMAKRQPLGEVADRHWLVNWCTGNLQQQLMLLGGNSGCCRGLLTEVEESAQCIAEFGQRLNMLIGMRDLGGLTFMFNISYHDTLRRSDAWLISGRSDSTPRCLQPM